MLPDLFRYKTEFLLPQLSIGISYKKSKPNNKNPTVFRTHTSFLCDMDVKLLYAHLEQLLKASHTVGFGLEKTFRSSAF